MKPFVWNVALDPEAYAEVLHSGLPVDWYPCAAKGPPRDGRLARGARNTFWKARQSALLADLPGPPVPPQPYTAA